MFGKRIPLFRLLGFEVRIDLSWLILALLITWTLAQGLFPRHYEGLSALAYWLMGVAGALGLFMSIIFHELSHSLIARRYGLPMKGITLFIFGGVAEMSDEPPSPKAEFMMAIAGPGSSILLGLGLAGLLAVAKNSGWPPPFTGVVGYLSLINFILAGFNLVPAFPLDGGRVLRSILWGWKRDLKWATGIASSIGAGFGMVLIIMGVFTLLLGDFIGGLWWFLIGLFLRNASQMSYQQLTIRQALEGEPVRRFMITEPVTVPPDISLAELVENYAYRHYFKMFPVVSEGKLVGCITLNQIREIPREEWAGHKVSEFLENCSADNTIGPDEDAVKALSRMSQAKASRLMVVDAEGKLVGLVSLKDMLGFLSLKIDLERR